MKKFIFFLIHVCLIFNIIGSARDDKDMILKREVFISKSDETIVSKLYYISRKTKIPFNLELEKSVSLNRSFINIGKTLTIEGLIELLNKNGFRVHYYSSSFLFSETQIKEIKNNPLDTVLKGFSFKGTHNDFIKKIFSEFPGIQPDLESFKGIKNNMFYIIDIKKNVTIRDVFMEVSSKYGLFWYAEIAKQNPSYEIKTMDGTVTTRKGSRVTMYFQNIK